MICTKLVKLRRDNRMEPVPSDNVATSNAYAFFLIPVATEWVKVLGWAPV